MLANGPRPGRGETASTSDALNRVGCARPLTRDTLAVPQHPVEFPARGIHGATEPGTNHTIRCQGTGAAQTPDGTKPTGPDPHGPGQPEARERAGGPKLPTLGTDRGSRLAQYWPSYRSSIKLLSLGRGVIPRIGDLRTAQRRCGRRSLATPIGAAASMHRILTYGKPALEGRLPGCGGRPATRTS